MKVEKEVVEKYVPSTLSVESMVAGYQRMMRRSAALDLCYGIVKKTYRRYYRRTHSNNWLKMHGYPMKRRGI